MNIQEALQALKEKFSDAILNEVDFRGEITVEVKKDQIKEILAFLRQRESPGFELLIDLTAVDYLLPTAQTKVVYWLRNPSNLQNLRITLFALRDEPVPSIVDLWKGANWYEREVYDLFGVNFKGHPDLTRILMPNDWQGHPLRRDYPLTEEPVEFKHGVKPKIPSQVIPNVNKNSAKTN